MPEYWLIEQFADVEQTLIKAMTTYFHDRVQAQKVYPNFGVLRIDETHPAAILNVALINSKPVPGNLFPSITVSAVEDSVGPQVLNLERTIVEVDKDWATEQLSNPFALKSQVQALIDFMEAEDRKVFGYATVDRIQERVLNAIWADNREIRNFLYNHARAFYYQNRELLENAGLQNMVLAGTPSGLYNMDFGNILYGAELSLTADRSIAYVYLNTDWTAIEQVDFTVGDISDVEVTPP